MQIEISRDTSKKVNDVSRLLGIRNKKLIDRALLFYLDSIQKQLDLKKEMNIWDELSDEALVNFEKSL
jgi:hypothetical protein